MSDTVIVLGWALLHFVWQGALLGVAAALGLRLLRFAPPGVRYLLACATLVVMLVSPLATIAFMTRAAVSGSPAASSAAGDLAGRTTSAASGIAVPAGIPAVVTPSGLAPLEQRFSLLVVLWAGGVALMSLRLAGGWHRVRRLRRRALTSESSRWSAAAARMGARLGLTRLIRVVESDDVSTAMLVGWLRPVVILPAACLAGLSPRQVEAILAHEIAHVSRHDVLVSVCQSIVETLLFYHPAVWWTSARVREEREYCCDDTAVRACGDPGEYVAALAKLEAWRAGSQTFAVAATGGSLLARARRLLDGRVAHRPAAPCSAAVLLLIVLTSAAAIGQVAALDTARPGATPPTAPVSAVVPVPFTAVPIPTAELTPAAPVVAIDVATPQPLLPMPATAAQPVAPLTTDAPRHDTALDAETAAPAVEAPQGDAAASRAPDRRNLIYVFDLTSLQPDDLTTLKAVVLESNEQMKDTDRAAVVAIGTRLTVVTDFTSDPEAIRTALLSPDLVAGGDAPTSPAASAGTRLRLLGTLCEMLAPIAQRKTLLFMGGGLRFDAVEQADLRQATNACNRANVSIYPADARKLEAVRSPDATRGRGGQDLFLGRE